MKIKYVFLVLFISVMNSLIFSIDITERKPVLGGHNTYPLRFFNEGIMLSSFNEKTVIYVSDLYYIDTQTLDFVNYFTPSEPFRGGIRPPYSNNTMPYVRKFFGDYYSVNIETNEHESISGDSYDNFFLDSDRQYNTSTIHTPEYSVTIETGWLLWFVGKDNKQIPEGYWHNYIENDNNTVIKGILLSDFQGTVFDNNYWLETFDTLLSSLNIITKYEISLNYFEGYTYLMERVNSYFNVNIKDLIDTYFRINIYENGFFIYDREKIVLCDIKNNEVTLYDITEFPIQENSAYKIIVHDNCFFIIFTYEINAKLGVYKLLY